MLREFRDLLPAFMNFTSYRTFDECPLWISFFVFQQGNSIILKADTLSCVSSIWLSLPYHDSIENLSFHVRLSRPNRYFTQSPTLAYCCLPLRVFPCFTPVMRTMRAPLLSAATTMLPMLRPRVTRAFMAFILMPPLLSLFQDRK